MMVNIFSQRGREMEHEREVVNCQLQQQLEDVSSVSDVLSALSCEIKVLYHTLSEQSKWWLQVWFCCLSLCIKHNSNQNLMTSFSDNTVVD